MCERGAMRYLGRWLAELTAAAGKLSSHALRPRQILLLDRTSWVPGRVVTEESSAPRGDGDSGLELYLP